MFKLSIHTDNAAFEDMDTELARCLRNVADRVEAGQASGAIMDANGNRVGHFDVVS